MPTRTDMENLLILPIAVRFGPFVDIPASSRAADGTTVLASYMEWTNGLIVSASGYATNDRGTSSSTGTYVRMSSATPSSNTQVWRLAGSQVSLPYVTDVSRENGYAVRCVKL